MMIQNFQKASQSLAFKIFLGILAVAFVIMWGVGDVWTRVLSPSNVTIASVGKKKIKMDDFAHAIEKEIRFIRLIEGKEISHQDFARMGLDRMVLQNLIRQSLFDQECERLGLRIGDDLVVKTIRKTPGLVTKAGEFDRNNFNRYLQALGVNEKEYIEQVRKEISRNLLLTVSVGGFHLPKAAFDLIQQRTHHTLTLRLLRLPLVPVSNDKNLKYKVAEPTEDQLKKFYTESGRLFRVPEYRTVSIMRLGYDVFPTNLSEAEIRKAFDTRRGQEKNVKYEDVKSALRLSLLRERNASKFDELRRKVDDKIGEGLALEQIAETFKPTIELKAIKLENVNRLGGMKGSQNQNLSKPLLDLQFAKDDFADILRIIFATEEKQTSQIVELPSGAFVLIQVHNVQPSYLPEYKDVGPEIKKAYLDMERFRLTHEMAKELVASYDHKDRKAPVKLLEAKAGQSLKIISDARYKLMQAIKQENIQGFEQYIDILNKGDVVMLPDIKEKTVVLLQVAEITPFKGTITEEAQKTIGSNLTKELHNDAMNSYLEHLTKQYRIEINKKALEKSPLVS